MSEQNDLPPPPASSPEAAALPPAPLPEPAATAAAPAPAPGSTTTESMAVAIHYFPAPDPGEETAKQRIAALEREAKALGADPAAAPLFHEIGLLWEEPLKNPRNAAVAFQNAFKLAPRFLSNIRAARRLFADVGNWQMVLQLLDAELSIIEDERQKATLLLEKGNILEERLSRDEEAAAAYRQCLDLAPADLTLLLQLEAIYEAKQDFEPLIAVYRLMARAIEDAPLRAHCLTGAGLLLEERLKRPEEAAASFREAFAIDRRDLVLLAAIKRVAERDGRTDELLDALAAEAELLGPQAAPAYLQLCKVYEKLGRPEDALSALLAARRVSPNEPLVLSELSRIYESQGRYEDLADVLLAWVGSIHDESEMVAINLRLAALYEEDLKRDADAIGRYRAILERVSGHQAALAGLGKLYFRTGDWEGLVAVFDTEARVAEDPRQKAARMYKAAEILEERLGRQDDAITRYNQCLQVQPGYLPAQKALTRLYERQGRFADLVGVYEQDLLQTTNHEQAITTLNQIATLYEERLADLDRAIDCMKRVLELVPDHLPTLHNLARLHERAKRWQDLIQLHEVEASLAGDTKQVLSLHHRTAEILEEHLKDRAGAIAAYERLLALSPSYVPALKALGRLYAQDGRWADLIKMYRAESEISALPEQAAGLIFKIGELYEHRLKDENQAIASYQEVLTLSPSYFPALRALARIWRGQQAWESLIEVLRSEAANRTDPVQRANALFQAAAIWEDHLHRPEMAIEGYQEVLRLTPGHPSALHALERLYALQGNVKELITILDRESQTASTPEAKVAAYLKLAHLYLDHFNEPSRAVQCCEAALALVPDNLDALRTLERIRAADHVRLSEIRARLASRVNDPRLQAALRLASIEEKPSEALLDEMLRASMADPSNIRLAAALEHALRQVGDVIGLANLYERQFSAATDPMEKVQLALRVAQLSESKLDQPERAIAFYRSALDLAPNLLPALQGARRVWLKLGDYASARAALEAEGASSRDATGALEALVAAGRICAQRLGDPEGAIANFQKALDRDPLNPAASRGLEELLSNRGADSELAGLYERHGEARLVQRDLPAAAADFFAAARTWLDGAQDRARALAAADRALAAQPSHAGALELRGQLCLEAGQYAEAAAALSSRIQQGGDPRALALIHLKLGMLYQDHLQDLSRAAAHLQTASAEDPQGVEALDRLATIHTTSRNWTGAADCLKQLLELEQRPAELARHTLALARLMEENFGDAAQASALYGRALELTPSDGTIIERMVALYERTNNLPELIAVLERQAAQTSDKARALALRLRVGEIHARSLNDVPKAIATYRQVVDLDGGYAAAHAALAELYARDAASSPMAIQEHLAVVRLEPGRLDSYHQLFRLWEGARQADRAFCAASVLHFLHAADDVELAFYSEAKNRLGQERPERLSPAEIDLLLHPRARGPLIEVLRAIGDQLTKLYPPQLESLGVDRKADKLKPEHVVHKAIRTVAQVFGVEDFDVYQARRGMIALETTDPLGVCVGADVVRRFNAREQKFLIARAVLELHNRTAVLSKLSSGETADLLGCAVRIHQPAYTALGRRNDELTKQLRRACSRKALKALEGPAAELAEGGTKPALQEMLEGLSFSGDRAGLLVCGDVSVALNLLVREEPTTAGTRIEDTAQALQVLASRGDMRELLSFALSEDFFRLRQRIGVAL